MSEKISSKLVSVVIPLYNHAKFITETIESIVQQTYKNLELIIVDDGSKDNSFAVAERVCKKHQGRFQRIIMLKQANCGAAVALNKCVSLAKGSYLAIQSSDDLSEERRIEAQVEHIQKRKIDVSFTGGTIINSLGAKIGKRRKSYSVYTLHDILSCSYVLPAPSILMTRAHFDKIEGFGPSKLEDMEFIMKTLKCGGTLEKLDGDYIKYRRHEANTSNDFKFLLIERLKLIKKFTDDPLETKFFHIPNSWLIFLERSNLSSSKKIHILKSVYLRNKSIVFFLRFWRVVASMLLPRFFVLRLLHIK